MQGFVCMWVCSCVHVFGVSYLTGVCHQRVFTASSVGSFLVQFNSLIVSCGVCRDGTLCLCICPISNRFCTNKFISGCECFIATVLAELLDFKAAFVCASHLRQLYTDKLLLYLHANKCTSRGFSVIQFKCVITQTGGWMLTQACNTGPRLCGALNTIGFWNLGKQFFHSSAKICFISFMFEWLQ